MRRARMTRMRASVAALSVTAMVAGSLTVGQGIGYASHRDTPLVAGNDSTPVVANYSLEMPRTGSWIYNPAGGAWGFWSSAGVTTNGSGFTSGNPPAPHGTQVGLVQGTGELSQTSAGWKANTTYRLTFKAAQRANCCGAGGQTWDVRLDDQTVLASFAPPESATSYENYSVEFTTTAGTHTLRFVGTNLNGGDNTVFIDSVAISTKSSSWAQYASNPFTINLDFPIPTSWPDSAKGGILVHELNGGTLLDFVITAPGKVAAYTHNGVQLWSVNSAINLPGPANGGTGYPGTNGPGAVAGDRDGDRQAEVMYVTDNGTLVIRNGATGAQEQTFSFPGAQAMAVANFRGLGNRDALLQYSQSHLRAINLETGATLWDKTNWTGLEHSMVRVVDVNGDGRDEVVGPNILNGSTGQKLNPWDLPSARGTNLAGLDSLAVGDISPGGRVEVALAEQDTSTPIQGETIVVNDAQIRWGTTRPPGQIPPSGQCATEKDPDKVAVGDFSPSNAGLEVVARSACANHPWMMRANGVIAWTWNVPDTAPAGWFAWGRSCPPGENCVGSEGGIDVVTPILWETSGQDRIMVQNREVLGAKTAIVTAGGGVFLEVFNTEAIRSTYVADISGDYREEVIVTESLPGQNGRIRIYWNGASNPNPDGIPRKWSKPEYGRVKQNWNYYSPS